MKPIRVYDYADYRVFLKDAIKAKIAINPRLSLRAFAKRAGFASPGYVQMVMSRKKNLSRTSIKRIAGVLGLDDIEGRFFVLLVQFNQSRNLSEKRIFIDEMYSLAKSIRNIGAIRVLGLDFVWYNFVILELATCQGFKLTPETAFRSLKGTIALVDIFGAFHFLENQGFLKNTGNSYELAAYEQLVTPDEIQNLNVQEIHRSHCRNAESALRLPVEAREYQGITLAMSQEKFAELKRRIKSWSIEIGADFSNDSSATDVYQINLQAFPVTDIRASRKEWQ